MSTLGTLSIICIIILVLILCIPFYVFSLALITIVRNHLTRNKTTKNTTQASWSNDNSSIFTGRVSHKRYNPVIHKFSYPLFLMYIDLNEINTLFHNERGALWPLNSIISFRESDHLKNNEGNDDNTTKDFADRIRSLVYTKTQGKCVVSKEQKIFLLTHLCYFGYCFNPVSFYYIFSKDDTCIEAIVAEVSNTPWIEMKCYVLHPASNDMVKLKTNESYVNYTFPKSFHVSPFMGMNYIYDWTFWIPSNQIKVSADMIQPNTKQKEFNAFFNLTKCAISPMNVAYQLVRLPCYCVIIQIWIHIEAFWLFVKGVTFIPHPEEKETLVSSVIAMVMIPFFKIKERFGKKVD